MRHGESNGRVKVEESNFIRRDEALQAVFVDFLDNGEYRRRYPACYLYNAAVRQYVKIQYNSLVHYMSLMVEDDAEYLCVKVERCIYSGNPKVIYVR
jgi:hypothetical protein